MSGLLTISVRRLEEGCVQERERLREALCDIGFFYITDCGLREGAEEDMRQTAQRLFAMPLEMKEDIHISRERHFRGWSALDEEVTNGKPDFKETFDFARHEPDKHSLEGYHSLRGPNPPVQIGDEDFSSRLELYMKEMERVALVILSNAAIILGCSPDSLTQYFTPEATTLIRFIKYPPCEKGGQFGVGAHTDYGFLTIILQDETVSGLEAQTRSGEWIEVPPLPHTFAVNIGDTLQAWSKNIFRATPHQVRNNNPQSRNRYSIPFFFDPSLDACIIDHNGDSLGLSHQGDNPVFVYGEHLYRAYMRSYPTNKEQEL